VPGDVAGCPPVDRVGGRACRVLGTHNGGPFCCEEPTGSAPAAGTVIWVPGPAGRGRRLTGGPGPRGRR
jgi:hypothetical protein